MDEARTVLRRLRRIEALEREGAPARSLLAEVHALIGEAEAWVEAEHLRAIRFELDGRCYVMEAGDADWTSVPRPVVPERT
jgi:hypothetical protein